VSLALIEYITMYDQIYHLWSQIYSSFLILSYFGVAYYIAPPEITDQLSTLTKKRAVIGAVACFVIQIVKHKYVSIGIELFRRVEDECKIVEQQSKERETFFACMSHEIRNPTQAIVGALELLFPTVEKSIANKRLIEIAKGGCEMVMNLISNILDVAKIKANKMELSISSCNLKQTITKVIQLLKPKAESKGLYLKYINVSPSQLPSALDLDFRKLSQVIMNLIGNAIKFTSKGGITINVSWEWDYDNETDDGMNIADEGEKHIQNDKYFANLSGTANARCLFPFAKIRKNNYTEADKDIPEHREFSSRFLKLHNHKKSGKVQISVVDTGIGIKEEAIHKLFQPFNQADSSISGNYGGTGLGLWISKSIIELMKGKILIKSIEGVGSTFTVMFPANISQEAKCFTGSIDPSKEYEKFIRSIFFNCQ